MDELLLKLEKLKQSQQEYKNRLLEKRKADWDRVKSEHPQMATDLQVIFAAFGKPKRLVIKTDKETILDSADYQ